jgi:hypothetical protein
MWKPVRQYSCMRGPYTGLPGLAGKLERPANAPGERHTQLKVTREMKISRYCKSVESCPYSASLILQTNMRIRPTTEGKSIMN